MTVSAQLIIMPSTSPNTLAHQVERGCLAVLGDRLRDRVEPLVDLGAVRLDVRADVAEGPAVTR